MTSANRERKKVHIGAFTHCVWTCSVSKLFNPSVACMLMLKHHLGHIYFFQCLTVFIDNHCQHCCSQVKPLSLWEKNIPFGLDSPYLRLSRELVKALSVIGQYFLKLWKTRNPLIEVKILISPKHLMGFSHDNCNTRMQIAIRRTRKENLHSHRMMKRKSTKVGVVPKLCQLPCTVVLFTKHNWIAC